jgi:hypothetical protein
MNIDSATTTFDQQVRYYVYDQTIKTTISPTVTETAVALSSSERLKTNERLYLTKPSLSAVRL